MWMVHMKNLRKNINIIAVASLLVTSSLTYSMPSYAISAPPTNPPKPTCFTQIQELQARIDTITRTLAKAPEAIKFTEDQIIQLHTFIVNYQNSIKFDQMKIGVANTLLAEALKALQVLKANPKTPAVLLAAAQKAYDTAAKSLLDAQNLLAADIQYLSNYTKAEATARADLAVLDAEIPQLSNELAQKKAQLVNLQKTCK